MKNTNWEVEILNPINQELIEKNTFKSIEDISNKYKNITLSTWRNIALGRGKVYKKFINVKKIKINNSHNVPINNEHNEVLETIMEDKEENISVAIQN